MKIDVLARFHETIPMVKSVLSSEIEKFWIFTEITILPFFRKLEFFLGLTIDQRIITSLLIQNIY